MAVIVASAMALLFAASPAAILAQSDDGVEITFYGYFSPDETTVLTLEHW